jgi:hypothetical protein
MSIPIFPLRFSETSDGLGTARDGTSRTPDNVGVSWAKGEDCSKTKVVATRSVERKVIVVSPAGRRGLPNVLHGGIAGEMAAEPDKEPTG